MKFKKNNEGRHSLEAKFTVYDANKKENILHRVLAKTTEKHKGLSMIEIIENLFAITQRDREQFFKNMQTELQRLNQDAMTPTVMPLELEKKQIKWTRDEKGNIVSPFRSNRKIV